MEGIEQARRHGSHIGDAPYSINYGEPAARLNQGTTETLPSAACGSTSHPCWSPGPSRVVPAYGKIRDLRLGATLPSIGVLVAARDGFGVCGHHVDAVPLARAGDDANNTDHFSPVALGLGGRFTAFFSEDLSFDPATTSGLFIVRSRMSILNPRAMCKSVGLLASRWISR